MPSRNIMKIIRLQALCKGTGLECGLLVGLSAQALCWVTFHYKIFVSK